VTGKTHGNSSSMVSFIGVVAAQASQWTERSSGLPVSLAYLV
jgi:hypothetical protein